MAIAVALIVNRCLLLSGVIYALIKRAGMHVYNTIIMSCIMYVHRPYHYTVQMIDNNITLTIYTIC